MISENLEKSMWGDGIADDFVLRQMPRLPYTQKNTTQFDSVAFKYKKHINVSIKIKVS